MTDRLYGRHGRLCRIDLSCGVARVEAVPEREWRHYAGAGLLGVRRLLLDTPAGLDPFDARATLGFFSSAVIGYPAIGLPKFTVVGKSPLSGGIGEVRAAGPFAVALKGSGYDAIVCHGRAQRPSYLLVAGGTVELVAADELWGLETHTATALLKERHPGSCVAVIGPAGERLVRYAGILTEWIHPAARMGLGAVMGSKNLKAVVIVGGALPEMFDPAAVAAITQWCSERVDANPLTAAQASPTGFAGWFLDGGLTGYAGVGNFQSSELPAFTDGDTEVLRERLTGSAGNCPGCPNDCVKRYRNGVDPQLGGNDEEGLAALVLGCAVSDIDTALDLHARCHALGLDPVSFAGTWCYAQEVDRCAGVTVAAAIESIALREPGFIELGEGVRRACAGVGPALHVKGVEFGRYDPRASAGQALAYAVSPLGPRYEIVEHDLDFDPTDGPSNGLRQMTTLGFGEWQPMERLDEERVNRTAVLLDLWSGLDALGICLFAGPPMRELTQQRVSELVAAVTGWVTSDYEIFQWGRRRWNLMRVYNLREGITAAEDWLPDRFFDDAVDSGRLRGSVIDRAGFALALSHYYRCAGWDEQGRPREETLRSLGLLWAAA